MKWPKKTVIMALVIVMVLIIAVPAYAMQWNSFGVKRALNCMEERESGCPDQWNIKEELPYCEKFHFRETL